MRAVSSRFLPAVSTSHRLATRATVLPSGLEIPIESGSVTLDQTAQVRGTCDVTLSDDGSLGLVPDSATHPLAPYGDEVKIERGVEYAPGDVELVSLGVFGINDIDVEDGASTLTLEITGLDRSARISNARFEDAYQVAAGTNYNDAITAVLQSAWADIPLDLTATDQLAPQLSAAAGDDPWAFVQSMATAIGVDLYFDGDGICVSRPAATTSTPGTPITLTEGDGGLLVQAGRTWTRTGAYNAYIATGENTTTDDPPARGTAYDLNPASPTYYYGPFGKTPGFYSSEFLATDEQAAAAAASMLAAQLGTTQSVKFGAMVLAHLEPNDVVRITRQRAGINELHVIDSLQIPLDALTTMTGATRAVQTS